jgi:4-hydroxy-tetrahydrodipicolinate reductase
MKIALLGKGKTGSKVIELAKNSNHQVSIFDKENRPTLEKLTGHDVIISFLPGAPFLELIPLLLETKLPLVTGSTGFEWPIELDQELKNAKQTWIWGHNFSMGINLVKACLEVLGKAKKLFPEATFDINEIHHTQKRDSPSGTALSFQNWLSHDCKITSERTGDVVGIHQLNIKTDFEQIHLEHKALDRSIFANGAIYAATMMIEKKNTNCKIANGLLNFSTFMEQIIDL